MWADRFSGLAKRKLVPRRPINFASRTAEILNFKKIWDFKNSKILNSKNFKIWNFKKIGILNFKNFIKKDSI